MAQLTAPAKKDTQKSLFDDKIQYVASFLLEHYDIQISVQDPSKKYIVCKDTDRKGIEPKFSEISLHLAAHGITVGDATLRKIMCSPYYIPHIDPIKLYFDGIRGKWNGTSQLDLLMSHITVRAFEDKTDEEYITRARNLMRKWMVANVAMWLTKFSNDIMLVLVQGAGGSGKTYLTRWLLPESLQDYYIESSNNPKNFDIEDAYTRFMLVNYEETIGINKSTITTWKKVQTADSISIKERGELRASNKKRLGAGIMSTNLNPENGGFIMPYYDSDTRRVGTIEILDIDQNYSTVVDRDQLWAEMLTLFESSNFEYRFYKADYDELNAYNERYKQYTNEMRIMQKTVRKPEGDEPGELLTPSQILERLPALKRVTSDDMKNISPQTIGKALNALGYHTKSFRSPAFNMQSVKAYQIVFRTNDEITNKKEGE